MAGGFYGQCHRWLRRKSAGQSVIEFAIATPVLLYLFTGAFQVGVLISDKVVAGYAVRQGARLAAELGGTQTNPTATTAQIDQDIVRNVLAVANALNYSVIQEVDVYQPSRADGVYSAGDPIDKYSGTGASLGVSTFPISIRNQIPPIETSIGVRLTWTYTPPTGGLSFTITLSEYAVMKASPVLI